MPLPTDKLVATAAASCAPLHALLHALLRRRPQPRGGARAAGGAPLLRAPSTPPLLHTLTRSSTPRPRAPPRVPHSRACRCRPPAAAPSRRASPAPPAPPATHSRRLPYAAR
ncbi:hypothetical protein PVAP13_6KG410860 [Panicum virgatum]|uniref:Uncharacterized protein n=1 Tax=Panicum virgatum TaxID=38727 RepID=A0A8T0RK10_PANVG|nr:hypothetical protein PVAP13_6KG410860 [Panicum virgatum]